MRSTGAFSTFLLIAAVAWLAVGIFMPSTQSEEVDHDLWAWMAEENNAADSSAATSDTVQEKRTRDGEPLSLDDDLWAILLPEQEDRGFSGTGGSLLIRPVATGDPDFSVPRGDLEAAVEGALSGTDEGLAALQDYFDVVGGNDSAIAYRAQVLLEALAGDPTIAGSLPALTEVATQLSEAAFASQRASYLMRANLQPSFALPPGAIGFDFGPIVSESGEANPAYQGFVRVPADSGHLEGNTSDIETSSRSLWGDGVRDPSTFSAEIPNGTYRVFVMTSEEAGINPNDAFGTQNFLRRETPLRRVDLLNREGQAAQALMDRQGMGATLELPPTLAADGAGGKGSVLAFRTEVRDGQLYVDFPAGAESTYIVGLVIMPEEDILGAQLSEMVSDILETIQPAAGPGPGQPTQFAAATTTPPDSGGGGGFGPGPSVPFTDSPPSGDGDGTPGDGDGTPPGDGDGTPPDPSIALIADSVEVYQAVLGVDETITLDGTMSLIDGLPIDPDNLPDGLLVEWLFDLDGDGVFEPLEGANDLVQVIDVDVFGETGEFQGILRLTLDGVSCEDPGIVCEDGFVVIITAPGGGPVPEPGTTGMLLGGAVALAVLRRRRRLRQT